MGAADARIALADRAPVGQDLDGGALGQRRHAATGRAARADRRRAARAARPGSRRDLPTAATWLDMRTATGIGELERGRRRRDRPARRAAS